MSQHIQNYEQKWNQHVLRMPENRLQCKALQYQPQGKRYLGRPYLRERSLHAVAERELITQNCEWKKKKKKKKKKKDEYLTVITTGEIY